MTDSMTCEQFQSLLPRLLDDEIEMTADARAHHIERCDACRSLVADLRAIRAKAAALPSLEPRRDLWTGIAARIEAPVVSLGAAPGSARRQLSWRAAGLAAAVLVAVTTTITYRMVRRDDAGTPAAVATTPAPSSQGFVLTGTSQAAVAYDREIARLRAVLDSGRTRLDPATVALLERNLGVIDSAIVQCRDALAKDPGSTFLIESLNTAYQTKVKLMRIAAAASAG